MLRSEVERRSTMVVSSASSGPSTLAVSLLERWGWRKGEPLGKKQMQVVEGETREVHSATVYSNGTACANGGAGAAGGGPLTAPIEIKRRADGLGLGREVEDAEQERRESGIPGSDGRGGGGWWQDAFSAALFSLKQNKREQQVRQQDDDSEPEEQEQGEEEDDDEAARRDRATKKTTKAKSKTKTKTPKRQEGEPIVPMRQPGADRPHDHHFHHHQPSLSELFEACGGRRIGRAHQPGKLARTEAQEQAAVAATNDEGTSRKRKRSSSHDDGDVAASSPRETGAPELQLQQRDAGAADEPDLADVKKGKKKKKKKKTKQMKRAEKLRAELQEHARQEESSKQKKRKKKKKSKDR